jgi:hypothetical protein
VFGLQWPNAWVCWKSNMKGKRVKDLVEGDLPDDEDCYFSIGMMREGAPARRTEWCRSVHAFVIDDVGTKIDKDAMDMIAPPPTWPLETSEGNWHYGYAIEGGMDKDEYRLLREAMKSHPVWGASDNATDPVHLYRLPQGTNTKTGWRVVPC